MARSSLHARAAKATGRITISVARTLNDFSEVIALRSIVYVGEQNCPFYEEFDANDLAGATHLVARVDNEPVGVIRVRWFAGFAKAERAAVRREYRGRRIAFALMDEVLKLASRKGYSTLLGHVEPALVGFWCKRDGVRKREGRTSFTFSERNYTEIVFDVPRHADALSLDSSPLVLLRPEGAWDRPGVLDRSNERLNVVAR